MLKSKDPVIGQKYNLIFIIIEKLTKWGYFIPYTEEMSVKDIAQVYTKEVFTQYRALAKIILDYNIRFILAF